VLMSDSAAVGGALARLLGALKAGRLATGLCSNARRVRARRR
jgi:hypothetical protein